MCSLSSVNQDTAVRHDTFLSCTGYHSAWDFTQLVKNKKFLFTLIFIVSGGFYLTSEHPPPGWGGQGEDIIDFQMALCRSAIFFPLTVSSLKISRFLEKKETLGCRQYQVPWDIGLVWCVVLVHVISEMRVGGFQLFVLSILKSIPPNKSFYIPCLLSAFACTARWCLLGKTSGLNAHTSVLVILDFWSSVSLD